MNKMTIAMVVSAGLVMGCRHARPEAPVSAAYLRQHLVGTWWSGERWITEPFSFVTFFADGRFTRSSTNGPIVSMRQGYWRVGRTNAITFTVEPGTLPAAEFMVFRVERLSEHEMVFSNPAEGRRIEFTR